MTSDEVLASLKAPESSSNPERIAIADERRARVLDRLEQLPEAQRTAVYLHYWMGAGVKEIAGLLEMKVDTVKSNLLRARQRLARELAGEVSADA